MSDDPRSHALGRSALHGCLWTLLHLPLNAAIVLVGSAQEHVKVQSELDARSLWALAGCVILLLLLVTTRPLRLHTYTHTHACARAHTHTGFAIHGNRCKRGALRCTHATMYSTTRYTYAYRAGWGVYVLCRWTAFLLCSTVLFDYLHMEDAKVPIIAATF